MMPRRRLGEILVRAGVLEPKDITAALREQLRWGGPLGRILVDMKMVSEDILVQALSAQLGIEAVALDDWEIPLSVIDLVPGEVAERHEVVPFNVADGVLEVAMSDPTKQGVIEELHIRAHLEIKPYVGGPKALERALARYYHRGAGMLDLTLGKAGVSANPVEESGFGAETSGVIVTDDRSRGETEEIRRKQPARPTVITEDDAPTGQPAASRGGPVPRGSSPSSPAGDSRTWQAELEGDYGLSQSTGAAPSETDRSPAAVLRDLAAKVAMLQQEMHAIQQRVGTLESLLNRDEDVLRKLLSLLIEKRVASREEILERIK